MVQIISNTINMQVKEAHEKIVSLQKFICLPTEQQQEKH